MGRTRSLESLKKDTFHDLATKKGECWPPSAWEAGNKCRFCGSLITHSENTSSMWELTVKCQLYFLFYQCRILFWIQGKSFLRSSEWFITFLGSLPEVTKFEKCFLATHSKEWGINLFPEGRFGQISWSDHGDLLGIMSKKSGKSLL